MAVTTTYAFDFVENIDLSFATREVDMVSLANGGFAAAGTHVNHVDLDVFNANYSDGGGSVSNTGTNVSIDQLADGNLVFVSQDADSILYHIQTGAGGVVVAGTDIGDADSSNADVAALTGGRFVIVNEDEIGAAGGDADIDVRIRNADGTAFTTFTIDLSLARDTDASVAALDNGNFAVAWQRTVGANTEVWRAVYDANGAVVAAAAVFDNFGTVNRSVDIVAKSGGFAVVYEDNGWGTGTNDITLAEFTSAGTFQSFSNISNPTFINDGSNDANAVVTRLANNLLVVGYEDNTFADTDNIVALFDAATNTRLATRNIVAGESVIDDVGDMGIAGSALGGINVFQTNFTDGDIDGEALVGRRNSVSDAAADFIGGDDFIDIMTGNGGDDFLFGAGNRDTLNGNDGDDTLQGGTGVDQMFGGLNNDTFIFQSGDVGVGEVIDGGGGIDRLIAQGSVNFRDAAFASIEQIGFGGGGPNIGLIASAQIGSGLSNSLVVQGVNGVTDQVRIFMGADTSVSLANWTFNTWVPGLPDTDLIRIFGDADNEGIVGSSVRDDIHGGDGTNNLNGALNSDILRGGGIGVSTDRFIFNTTLGAANVDRVIDFEIDIDEFRLENTVFTGLAAGNLNVAAFHIGGAAADASDRIIYNAANGNVFFDEDGLGGVAQVRFAILNPGLALDNLDFFVT